MKPSLELECSEAGRALARKLSFADQRRHTRVKPENLRSNMVRVENLSRGGALVVATRPLRGSVELILFRDCEALVLQADVRWTQRLGFRRFACGLEFHQLEDSDAAELRALALWC